MIPAGRLALGVAASVFAGATVSLCGPTRAEEPVKGSPAVSLAPRFTVIGAYGSPLALRSPGAVDLRLRSGSESRPPTFGAVPTSTSAVRGERPPRSGSQTPSGAGVDDDDDDAPAPATPGTLGRERVKAPTPVPERGRTARRTSTGLVPDYEVPLTPRTTLGSYGEVGKFQLDARTGHVPGVRARDAGGGLTLQYRFGAPP